MLSLPFPLAPSVDSRILQTYDATTRLLTERHKLTASSFGPSLDMVSTIDDVVHAYGIRALQYGAPPPTSRMPPSSSPSATAVAAEPQAAAKKRPRDGAPISTDPGASSGSGAEGTAASPAPFTPSSSVEERVDYMGRGFLHVPSHLKSAPASHCRLPSRPLFALKGHTTGVQQLAWVPPAGHLLFSADLSGKALLWDISSPERCVLGTYMGHQEPIRALCVSSSGTRMSTSSVDGWIRQWDVETGTLLESFRHSSGQPCLTHVYHPFNNNPLLMGDSGLGSSSSGPQQNSSGAAGGETDARLLLAAVNDKMVLWDARQSSTSSSAASGGISSTRPAREYAGHKSAILNISFLDGGRKILSTSEDKTIRTWEFRVPVQIQQFADAAMHAVSHVVTHPTEPQYLAAQSFDNRVVVLEDEGGGRVKFVRDREFTGHTIAGSSCQLRFSPDGQYVSSGDVTGLVHVWRWSTGEKLRSFQAHAAGRPVVSHLWHPTEPSRMVTSSWDGTIKMWS
eukprot:CAMPEP_0176410604 /NCGR_PEP_ID=MMETSP0127-20121128/3148_1 /TAXON_ID=938130 /ORGANISM="Platyophrya macrostoma, Strain WH" /LENGTH=509 /DNA_ID=CAMNT_0017790117 /DNA_START=148 /DNA_END=1677 /DNA_ORIENTATION=+